MARSRSALIAALATVVAIALGSPQDPAPPGRAARGRAGGVGGFTEPEPIDFGDTAGWRSMFDGQSLRGWDGNMDFWHVENGAIVAESTCEKPAGTIYLIWQGGEPGDFELKAELKGEGPGVNSGIQYRSFIQKPNQARGGTGSAGRGPGAGPFGAAGARAGGRGPQGPCPSGQPRGTPDSAANAKWNLGGPQADFDNANRYTGQYYEGGTARGIIAWRGQVVRTEEGKNPRLLATLGERDALAGYVKLNDWNQIHIVARGNELIHIINGHVMSILIDDDPTKFRKSGLIGVQIEGAGKVNFRNLWIKMAQ
jgi:hypothetical protein